MLDTYIKNRGTTKTLIHDNNHNVVNEIDWDVDYDGKTANISLDLQNNGKKKHYDVTLDNKDLANILNVPSVNLPLEKRLRRDFKKPSCRDYSKMYKIEFDDIKSPPLIPIAPHKKNKPSIEELLESINQPANYINSPLPNQELIVPLTIDDNNSQDLYTFTPKKQHKKIRTHKTYKVYKKPKSTPKPKSKTATSKHRRNTKKTTSRVFSFL